LETSSGPVERTSRKVALVQANETDLHNEKRGRIVTVKFRP
jgi:hypothetical protein